MHNFKYDNYCGWYEKEHYLSNYQYCKIIFAPIEDKNNITYDISFFISDYKIDFERLLDAFKQESTGRCGLEGLIWAKNQIIKFEKTIKDKHKHNVKIICRWEDNKRKMVYIHALSKLGYTYNKDKKWLYKIIK